MENSYRVVLGIGNPGEKYKNTRHNLGYKVVEHLADRFGGSFGPSRFQALLARAEWRDRKILLVKPLTYVNRSGICAKAVLQWYKLPIASLLVVVDDVALPMGKIRFRKKGSSGGHNGLKSIATSLGTEEFPRLRIGIGRDVRRDLSSFVLSPFGEDEIEMVDKAIDEAAEAVFAWLYEST